MRGWAPEGRARRPGRGPVMASVGVHVTVGALMAGGGFLRPDEVLFTAVEIEIVSPPTTVRGPEELNPDPVPELEVETPDPTPPSASEPPPPPPDDRPAETPAPDPPPRRPEPRPPEPRPRPEPARPAPPSPQPPPEEPRPSTTPDPAPPARESGMDITIRMEGFRRDFPEYFAEITRQIGRCFRWTRAGNLRASVRFTVQRDGTVTGIETAATSGDLAFDLEAEGAVECAGSRLKPLPEEYNADRLPILFTFRPPGEEP